MIVQALSKHGEYSAARCVHYAPTFAEVEVGYGRRAM